MGSFFRITYVESVERLQRDKLEVRLVYAYGYEELKEALLKAIRTGPGAYCCGRMNSVRRIMN